MLVLKIIENTGDLSTGFFEKKCHERERYNWYSRIDLSIFLQEASWDKAMSVAVGRQASVYECVEDTPNAWNFIC